MWAIFWIVTTLGFDGYLGSGQPAGRLCIAIGLLAGLVFTTMPITIVGEAFREGEPAEESLRCHFLILTRFTCATCNNMHMHMAHGTCSHVHAQHVHVHVHVHVACTCNAMQHVLSTCIAEPVVMRHTAWNKKEILEIEDRIRTLLSSRGLTANDISIVFEEFDETKDKKLVKFRAT
eukprot:6155765-Prymnesium_polylepis.2